MSTLSADVIQPLQAKQSFRVILAFSNFLASPSYMYILFIKFSQFKVSLKRYMYRETNPTKLNITSISLNLYSCNTLWKLLLNQHKFNRDRKWNALTFLSLFSTFTGLMHSCQKETTIKIYCCEHVYHTYIAYTWLFRNQIRTWLYTCTAAQQSPLAF